METENGPLGEQMKKILELTEENNRILKAMRRDKWIGFFLNILVWAALLYASYYFTMQFVGPLLSQFNGAGGTDSLDVRALLEQYQGLLKQ